MTDKLRLEFLLSAIDKVTAPLKQISAGSNATSRALKAARDQLKELNAQQSNISSYTRQREAVRQSSEELAKAQDKLRGLREQLQKMDAPTDAFQKAFVNASASVEKLTNKHTAQRSELQRLIPLMKSTGADTRNLGTTERRLKTEIEAANKAIQSQRDRLSALAKQQERVSKAQRNYSKGRELAGNAAVAGASAGAVGAATGMPIISMVKNYSRFEDAMAGVAKQVEGARDGNGQLTQTYYEMATAIKKMSETIPMATTDIAALVEGGARMGIQGKDDLLEFARVAATAATAFDLPAQEVGENLARIANLYKLPIKNVNQLGDAINFLDDNAMSKGGDIIDVMQRTAGITASVGMSFKDAAALGSTFLSLGASAEVAGSATNAMIRELAIATKQPKRFVEGLKSIGLEAQAVQDGMAKDATGTIQKVLDAVNLLPKNQQLGAMTELFGKEYGDDAAKLAANMGEYRRQLELVNGVDSAPKRDGSMQREGDIRGDQLSARWEMSQNRMFNLSSALGETLKPALVQLISGFNGVLERVNAWATANPGLVLGILKVGAGIAALSIGFSTVALGLATTLGPFLAVRYMLSLIGIRLPSLIGLLVNLGSKALPFVGQALMWVSRLFMANPIGLAITAIAAAAYLIYANWDKVKAYFASAWAEIKLGFSGGISGILQTLANFSPIGLIYQAFSAVMNYMGVELPTRFTEFGGMIISGLVNGITNAMGSVKTAISDAGSSTVDWFKEKLGIHSPSRVFAELGGFTMAGLAQGVAEGQSGPLEAVKAVGELMTQAGTVTIGTIANAGALLNPAAAVPGLAAATSNPAASVPTAAAAAMAPVAAVPVVAAAALNPASSTSEAATAVLKPAAAVPALKTESGGMLESILEMGKRLAQAGAMAAGIGGAQQAIAVDNRPPIAPAVAPAAVQMAPEQTVINIYPAPGMDAAAIARAVSAELDKRQHAKQAKGRSALFDQE